MQQVLQAKWSIRAWCVLAGLLAGLAHPPFGVLPGLLGYAVLLFLIEFRAERPLKSAFLRGWLAGLGYFGVSTWWIAEPFLVDVKAHGWMAPLGVLAMGGGLALFWGAAALVYKALRPQGVWKVLVFAGCLAGAEWLRGHILTGFPWNLPGETWAAGSAPSQAAAVFGAYGLSWITVAISASPVLLFVRMSPLARYLALSVAILALAGLYVGGLGRLDAAAPQAAEADLSAPLIRVVQADIDQKDKWKPENLQLIFDAYVSLTRRTGAATPDIVVWPEGALPAVIDDLLGAGYGAALHEAMAPDQSLLMGANRAEVQPGGKVRYFNALVAFRREGPGLRVTGIYDKHRLVPFGEFLPFGDLATKIGLRSLVHMPEDFTAGQMPRPLVAAGVPTVQPLICYESLFPGFTRQAALRAGERPKWILNISNDAWFGRTSGPLQHLNIASYRAIEEGLPIVRATPTGVSAVIDSYGRIIDGHQLNLGELGVIDARLPSALAPTPFSRFGDLPFAVMMALSGLIAAWRFVRR